MKKYDLYLLVLLTVSVISIVSCKPKIDSSNSKLVEDVKKLAVEANIPLFQLEFSDGQNIISFESSQIDTIPASEDGSSIFQAASLSKPIFGYIVMRMVDKGEIDLNTPIYQYTNIDRFENKEWAKMITPRMVLVHKTGLPNWATDSPTDDEWPTSPIRFKFKPDSAYSYSGEAFAFLQRAVEQIRGQSLQQIAEEEVFIPFNMPNSSYGWKESYSTQAAEGHDSDGKSTGIEIFPGENPGYTLRTTAKEYSSFVKNAVMEGKGLKPETYKLMVTPEQNMVYVGERSESDKRLSRGLGIAIEQNEELGEIYYHSGSNGDFKAFFMTIPKDKKYLVYMSNSHIGHSILDSIISLYFGNKEILNARR